MAGGFGMYARNFIAGQDRYIPDTEEKAPAASEGEEGPSYRTCRCNTGFIHQEKDCPAAQVAATPKHDEGREAAEVVALADELYTLAKRRELLSQRVSLAEIYDHINRLRALATQPAARRVPTVVAWYVFADTEAWATTDEHEADKNRADGLHVRPLIFGDMAESFAQPAEGVSGG